MKENDRAERFRGTKTGNRPSETHSEGFDILNELLTHGRRHLTESFKQFLILSQRAEEKSVLRGREFAF